MRSRAATGLEDFWAPMRAWRPAWLAGLLAFTAYAGGLSPLVHTFDPAEFQTLARSGGIAHSGYPTVVLLLQAFARLPFGSLPWRANLFSACFGAIAVGLLAYTAARWTRRPTAGVVSALAFALSFSMWKESSLAGVHAFTLALDGALFLLALRYLWWPSLATAMSAGLLFGIGLTSHLTVLGLALPLVVAFLLGLRRSAHRTRHIAAVILALALGLSPFLYTLASDRPDQPMNYLHDTLEPGQAAHVSDLPTRPQRLERLRWLVSGEQYLGGARRDPRQFGLHASYLMVDEVVNEFPFLTFPLALFGLGLLLSRAGPLAGIFALWFASVLVLVGIGASPHTSRFFFLPGAYGLALGLALALAKLMRSRPLAGAGVAVLVLAMPFVRLALPDPPALLRGLPMLPGIWRLWPGEWRPWQAETRYDEYGRAVMHRLPARAVVLGKGWDESVTLRYFIHGERVRPDVQVLYAGPRAPRLTRLWREARLAGRPVFTTGVPELNALPGARVVPVWHSAWRGLWRVESAAPDSPSGGVGDTLQ